MTDAQLNTGANVVKNEVTAKANTATRIGQMFLDIIANKINTEVISNNTDLSGDSGLKLITEHVANTLSNTLKTYSNTKILGLLNDRGNHDASTNLWPGGGGSGSSGAVLKGDVYRISVAGTLGGVSVGVGTTVRALVDAPAQVGANWAIMGNNITSGDASGITSVKTTLSSAQIKQMFTSPPTVVNAPGAGKIIIPLKMVFHYKFGTIAYTLAGGNSLYPKYPSATVGVFSATLLAATENRVYIAGGSLFTGLSGTFNLLGSPWDNCPLQLSTDTGDPTLGDGTMDVYTTYITLTI